MWRVSVLPSIPASNTISAKSPVSTVSSADTSDSNLPSTSHCVVCGVCVCVEINFLSHSPQCNTSSTVSSLVSGLFVITGGLSLKSRTVTATVIDLYKPRETTWSYTGLTIAISGLTSTLAWWLHHRQWLSCRSGRELECSPLYPPLLTVGTPHWFYQ